MAAAATTSWSAARATTCSTAAGRRCLDGGLATTRSTAASATTPIRSGWPTGTTHQRTGQRDERRHGRSDRDPDGSAGTALTGLNARDNNTGTNNGRPGRHLQRADGHGQRALHRHERPDRRRAHQLQRRHLRRLSARRRTTTSSAGWTRTTGMRRRQPLGLDGQQLHRRRAGRQRRASSAAAATT